MPILLLRNFVIDLLGLQTISGYSVRHFFSEFSHTYMHLLCPVQKIKDKMFTGVDVDDKSKLSFEHDQIQMMISFLYTLFFFIRLPNC